MTDVRTHVETIADLRNVHVGEDVWVVASGPSMSHVAPSFFAGRMVIGVNEVWRRFPVTYAIRKEHEGAQDVIDAGVPLVVAAGDCGGDTPPELSGRHWLFAHSYNQSEGPIDLDVVGTDRLVVSWSTTTTAIHFAAFLGARAVIVAGHDCGEIDGRSNFDGYSRPCEDGDWYRDWLGMIETQTTEVAERVTAVYGCPVVGFNPWPSLALNGHVHSGRVHV